MAGTKAAPASSAPVDIKQLAAGKKELHHVKEPKPAAVKDDAKAIKSLAELYTKHKGDPAAIAKETKCSESLLKANKPKDANDFAKKMLAGTYTKC